MAMLTDNPKRVENCKWDLKLIKAYYINKAFDIDGHSWAVEESSSIIWSAERKKLRSAEVVDREQERIQKGNGSNFGIRIFAKPNLRPGHKWPTRASVMEQKNSPERQSGNEKIANLAKLQEEKARQKMLALGLELP